MRGNESYFSQGVVLLMMLEVMEELIGDAIDTYWRDIEPGGAEVRALTELLLRQDMEELALGF